MSQLTRRTFAGALAGGAALLAQDPLRPAPGNFRRPFVPDTPPFEGKLEFRRHDVPAKVQPFPMSQVRLLPHSIYADAEEWNRSYMSRLAADRLLYTFRANA